MRITPIRSTLEHITASPQERWERGGASYDTRMVDGHEITVPVFDGDEVTNLDEVKVSPLLDNEGQEIGRIHDFTAEINRKHPRNARFWEVDGSEGLAISDRAALWTEIHGYPQTRARNMAVNHGVSYLQIGTEHSGPLEAGMCLPKHLQGLWYAAQNGLEMSIMKTAYQEELVAHEIYTRVLGKGNRPAELHDGDSQAAITTPARTVYAEHLSGGETAGIDIKAACCSERTSLMRALTWLCIESAGAVPVAAGMISTGEDNRLLETISRNPRLLIAATLGKVPAILAGEYGETIDMISKDTPGHVLRYKWDILSTKKGLSQYDDFPNIYQKTVPRRIHIDLVREKYNRMQEERLGRMAEVHNVTGTLKDLSPEVKEYIYAAKRPTVGEYAVSLAAA